jgi:hypothetical protein
MSDSGIDATGHMHHVVVFEAAHDTDDGIGFTDVGEELVAQPFTFRGAGDQTGDVDELDDCRLDALRLDDRRDLLQRADRGLRRYRRSGSMVQKG